MGTTSRYMLRYPSINDSPNGAAQLQDLAEDVDDKIGAMEATKLPVDPIDWTSLTLIDASDNGYGRRVRRLATGQVEVQLDVDITGTTSPVSVTTLPTWARPNGANLRFAAAAATSTTGSPHMDVRTDGEVHFVPGTGNIGSVTWAGIHVTYTP